MAGRPHKYPTHVEPRLAEVEQWIGEGVPEYEVAKRLGCSPQQFCEYKHQFAELPEAIKRGECHITQDVKNALVKRAIGFSVDEKKICIEVDGNGKPLPGKRRVETTTKYFAPDVAACMSWLDNKSGGEIRHRMMHEHGGPNGGPIQVVDLAKCSTGQLEQLAQILTTASDSQPATGPGGTGEAPV